MKLHRLPALLITAFVLLAASGCAVRYTVTEGGVPILVGKQSEGQDSRVLFLILHYTVLDFPQSMKVLTEQQVSSHYLLSDETPPRIWRLVDEGQRAWHSGRSAWQGHRLLNSSSIGIEIVHPGYTKGPNGEKTFAPFPEAQIQALIPLVKDIAQRHGIRPERILGHGEVSASYKEDPGPTFPWRRLAELGITSPWPDEARVAGQRQRFQELLPDAGWFQEQLAKWGYPIDRTGVFDAQTQRVLMNFQMRYRPADYSGLADAESAAILHVLNNPLPTAAAPAP